MLATGLALGLSTSSCRWLGRQQTATEQTADDERKDGDEGCDDEPQHEFPDNDIFLSDGFFRMNDEDSPQNIRRRFAAMDIHALYRDSPSGSYFIVPVAIAPLFSENNCTGGTDVSLQTDKGDHNYIALLSGLKSYNREMFADVFDSDTPEGEIPETILEPGRKLSFEYDDHRYSLKASAAGRDQRDNPTGYELRFSRDNRTSQRLVRIDHLNGTTPQLIFAGDLDGDGRPDLIISEGSDYEDHFWVLYLSSCAAEGELVQAVAGDAEARDC
ncbi:hypothetical protein FACS1894159_02100 [Bacteroidia bacterium]|nr:hypothetical protein FACS1894159_02100 [Bacteroidia bacterium]